MEDVIPALMEQFQNWSAYPLGGLAMFSQFLVNVVGLPMQYWKLKKTRSNEGVSFVMFSLAFVAVTFAAMHTSFEIMTLFILIPNIPAVIFLFLIIYQMLKNRYGQSVEGGVVENQNRSAI